MYINITRLRALVNSTSPTTEIMKCLLVVICLVAVCTAVPSIIDEWMSFKTRHGKSYSSPSEEHFRLGIYLSNKQMIEEHNFQYNKGLTSFELKINHFGDKFPAEISAEMNGFNRSGELLQRKPGLKFSRPDGVMLPSSVDWRQKGAVTPVKDQGSCGACWAFSTTGSLEGQMFLKTGQLVSLSEQNLVDCDVDNENAGCDGGFMDSAFDYIKSNGGIDSEDSYPYEGREVRCRYRSSEAAGTVSSYVDIPEEDEAALKHAVATIGPISVAINAGLSKFAFYRRGVFNDRSCDPADLNHGVLLVGYGTENGQDYWLVKNSWSSSWGEKGYVKIARNVGNLCGVASKASYPRV